MIWKEARAHVSDLARLETTGKGSLFDSERQSELARIIEKIESKFSQPLLCAGVDWNGLPSSLNVLKNEDNVTFLLALGNIDLLNSPSAGICGSRHATDRGLSVAAAAVKLLSKQDIMITSGYAAGVDMMAHLTALREGGGTIVVLPEGFSGFSMRRELRPYWDWSKILVLSQFSLTAPWKAWNAMRRNRTIMALSKLMLVVEARLTGGTYDAGKVSLQYGVPVFAVDFADNTEMSAGNRSLIGLGAQPLRKSRLTGEPSVENLLSILRE